MSLRRKSASTPCSAPGENDPFLNKQTFLAEVFKQKASFLGPVGTMHDVPDISKVQRQILTYSMGVTTSDSNNEEEWDKDIDYILSMYVSRSFEGNVQLMQRTDNGPAITKISIGIDQAKKEMIIMDSSTPVETFPFAKKDDLIKFLKNHIKTVMNLKLVDTFFRTFG